MKTWVVVFTLLLSLTMSTLALSDEKRLKIEIELVNGLEGSVDIRVYSYENHLLVKKVVVNKGECEVMYSYDNGGKRPIQLSYGDIYTIATTPCKVSTIKTLVIFTEKETFSYQFQ